MTLLYTNASPSTIPSTITLANSYKGYDYLVFILADSGSVGTHYNTMVGCEALKEVEGINNQYYTMRTASGISTGWSFYVDSETSLRKLGGDGGVTVINVYGMRL